MSTIDPAGSVDHRPCDLALRQAGATDDDEEVETPLGESTDELPQFLEGGEADGILRERAVGGFHWRISTARLVMMQPGCAVESAARLSMVSVPTCLLRRR